MVAVGKYIQESGRAIPIIAEVDLVVVGGLTGGVAAAVAAAESGCTVMLVEQHPYLGFDVCGTYRLWLEPEETCEGELEQIIFGSPAPTPMQVKLGLEQALFRANVRFLYCSYPTNVLVDADGRPVGIVIAGRAGRQAITAKGIIDATARAAAARMAGVRFTSYPSGQHVFHRIVVGNAVEPHLGPGIRSVRAMPTTLSEKGGSNQAYEYELAIYMEDGSFSSFARAEQIARDLTWDANQADAAEALYQVPPDWMAGRELLGGEWPGADQVNLNVFRPADLPRLYVLGGCAAMSRSAAADFLRPLQYMAVGRRIGKAAAAEVKALEKPWPVKVKPAVDTARCSDQCMEGIDTREILQGLRPTDQVLAAVDVEPQPIPVAGEYDVLVVGGGTAGAAAAISAARQGAKTLVLESSHGLGGLGTVGHVSTYFAGYRGGFTREIDAGVAALGGLPPWRETCWNIEAKMEWYRRELRKAGAEIWLHAAGIGALVEGGRVCGVIVATSEGRAAVTAKVVIDATGSADIAIAAGAEYEFGDIQHAALQGTGIAYREIHPIGKYGFVNLDWTYGEESDLVNVWHAQVIGKHRFANKYDLVHMLQTRERRRIVGEYALSPLDIVNGRTFPDTIAQAYSSFDSHGFFVHDFFLLTPPRGNYHANIPYRCLLPKGIEGTLVVGLGISAHRDAIPVIRMQSDVQNQGYAAGLAAAAAAKQGVPLRSVDLKELQRHLVAVGALTADVLSGQDSYPPNGEMVKAAVDDLVSSGYSQVGVILAAERGQALELLKQAYLQLDDEDQGKLRAAHVMAVMGEPMGLLILVAKVRNFSGWDEGWHFKVYGVYGETWSYLDSLVVAIGRAAKKARTDEALHAVMEKAKLLNSDSPFSHFRAVALALEAMGDPRAAAVLAELLSKPDMTGYAVTTIEEAERLYYIGNVTNTLRERSLREVILAGALYRLGDQDRLGVSILEQYSRDYRSLFARHAAFVLGRSTISTGVREGGSCLN